MFALEAKIRSLESELEKLRSEHSCCKRIKTEAKQGEEQRGEQTDPPRLQRGEQTDPSRLQQEKSKRKKEESHQKRKEILQRGKETKEEHSNGTRNCSEEKSEIKEDNKG